MKHVSQCGDLEARFTAAGPATLKLPDCERQPVSLDVIDRGTGEPILSTCHAINARMAWVFQKAEWQRINIERFNCYSTLRFVLGADENLKWYKAITEQGTKIRPPEALHSLTPPFVFQIIGDTFRAEDSPESHLPKIGPIHTGLVIGDSSKGPIVFEKCHKDPPGILPWQDVENFWRVNTSERHVTCFPASELLETDPHAYVHEFLKTRMESVTSFLSQTFWNGVYRTEHIRK